MNALPSREPRPRLAPRVLAAENEPIGASASSSNPGLRAALEARASTQLRPGPRSDAEKPAAERTSGPTDTKVAKSHTRTHGPGPAEPQRKLEAVIPPPDCVGYQVRPLITGIALTFRAGDGRDWLLHIPHPTDLKDAAQYVRAELLPDYRGAIVNPSLTILYDQSLAHRQALDYYATQQPSQANAIATAYARNHQAAVQQQAWLIGASLIDMAGQHLRRDGSGNLSVGPGPAPTGQDQ